MKKNGWINDDDDDDEGERMKIEKKIESYHKAHPHIQFWSTTTIFANDYMHHGSLLNINCFV